LPDSSPGLAGVSSALKPKLLLYLSYSILNSNFILKIEPLLLTIFFELIIMIIIFIDL
jgi:hypothetical protein